MMIIRTSFWKLYNFGFRLSICCCRCRYCHCCLLAVAVLTLVCYSLIHSFNTYLLKLFIFSFYLRRERRSSRFAFVIIWLADWWAGRVFARSVSRQFGFWTLSAPFHSQFSAEWISIVYYFSHCTGSHTQFAHINVPCHGVEGVFEVRVNLLRRHATQSS